MSNAIIPELQRLEADVRILVAQVMQRTGLTSRWSGTVMIVDSIRYSGAKRWNCNLDINRNILHLPRCYSTALHEVFHSVSVGLTEFVYDANLGYEEGVVEMCTRLFRDEIFVDISLPGPFDVRTSYDREIIALENLSARTLKPTRDFYLELLKTSLPDREEVVLQWIQNAEPMISRNQIEQETLLLRRVLKP